MRHHGRVRHERTTPERTPPRGGYHHGDLRNALSAAAAELAREGGPEAVVLREAARRVGVSPTAAYRHFENHADLLTAVKHEALADLADALAAAVAEADRTAPTAVGSADSPAAVRAEQQRARARLSAIGHGYVDFALAAPGLFRTAFCRSEITAHAMAEPETGTEPFDLGTQRAYRTLVDVLDSMLAAGLITPARRPGAETTAWAIVHGLATLLLDGPIRGLPDRDRRQMVDVAVATLAHGLAAGTVTDA
ncbi:TetR family transcriptional regulator [Streptomyces sp. 846.5]|nr:TetR/AcrR family transcriptional regulator [Streptomyces sp. 846.5]TDU02640.1 TetR family transcriptional regulator [Streptomyces sp. 846.5]